MIITAETMQEIQKISKSLPPHGSVTISNGKVTIKGEPKNRAEARKIKALQKRCDKLSDPEVIADEKTVV